MDLRRLGQDYWTSAMSQISFTRKSKENPPQKYRLPDGAAVRFVPKIRAYHIYSGLNMQLAEVKTNLEYVKGGVFKKMHIHLTISGFGIRVGRGAY